MTLDGEARGENEGDEGEERNQNVEEGVKMHYYASSEVFFAVESVELVLRSVLCCVVLWFEELREGEAQ